MTRYIALAVTTSYWKPKENYFDKIIRALEGKIESGDFVVVSEKAISTAIDCMVDESLVKPSLNARIIARFWMRLGWGYPLGILCHFGPRLRNRLRWYPIDSGSRHKQVALQYAGASQALTFGSEGGIDGSNLPYAYVSLPLENSGEIAHQVQNEIQYKLQKNVCVIIADTDKTYRFRNFFFTPRPNPLRGIHSFGGVATYVIGRVFNLKKAQLPSRLQATVFKQVKH